MMGHEVPLKVLKVRRATSSRPFKDRLPSVALVRKPASRGLFYAKTAAARSQSLPDHFFPTQNRR